MIRFNDSQGEMHEIVAIHFVDGSGQVRDLMEMFEAASLVWQAIRSCYGSGVWLENRPWLEEDAWREC